MLGYTHLHDSRLQLAFLLDRREHGAPHTDSDPPRNPATAAELGGSVLARPCDEPRKCPRCHRRVAPMLVDSPTGLLRVECFACAVEHNELPADLDREPPSVCPKCRQPRSQAERTWRPCPKCRRAQQPQHAA